MRFKEALWARDKKNKEVNKKDRDKEGKGKVKSRQPPLWSGQ